MKASRERISDRAFFQEQTKEGITLTVLAVFFAIQGSLRDVLAQPKPDQKPAESEISPEVQKVQALEAGFREFGKMVLPNLDRFVRSEAMRAKIRRAFQRVGENRKNQSGFSYHFSPYHNMSARFNGITRTIELPDDFDPTDFGDLSYLLHEVVHVEHDDELRRRVPWARYVSFWNIPAKTLCIVSHEIEAISVEMEALNAAFAGGLANGKVSVSARRKGAAATLMHNARSYFEKPGGAVGLYSFVREECERLGAKFFTPDLFEIH